MTSRVRKIGAPPVHPKVGARQAIMRCRRCGDMAELHRDGVVRGLFGALEWRFVSVVVDADGDLGFRPPGGFRLPEGTIVRRHRCDANGNVDVEQFYNASQDGERLGELDFGTLEELLAASIRDL